MRTEQDDDAPRSQQRQHEEESLGSEGLADAIRELASPPVPILSDRRTPREDSEDARIRPATSSARLADEHPHEEDVDAAVVADGDTVDNQDEGDAEVNALRQDLQRFLQEVNALPPGTSNPDAIAESESSESSAEQQQHSLGLQCAATGDDRTVVPMQTALSDSVPTELYRVIPFQDGIFRGQVVQATVPSDDPEENDLENKDVDVVALTPSKFAPHGFGVWTSPDDGSTRCGQWVHGVQSATGTQQHRGVFFYEGEWQSDRPWGYGVGTFANGCVFAGCWTRGRPYGLGAWRDMAPGSESGDPSDEGAAGGAQNTVTRGWFYGTQCVQAVSTSTHEEGDLGQQQLPRKTCGAAGVPARFQDQPLRGLFVMCARLEAWRMATFQRVFDQWRGLSCQQAVERGQRARSLAMVAWQQAQTAQQKAIEDNLGLRVEERKREDDEGIVQLAVQGRAKHARVLHVRQYHRQRRETAEFQCDLARCCVETQQDTIELMQNELSAIVALLVEARQAQADCSEYGHQLQLIKRQIENVSVKINDCRLREEELQRQQRLASRRSSTSDNNSHSGLLSRRRSSSSMSTPRTPGCAKSARDVLPLPLDAADVRLGDARHEEGDIALINPDYVCDVPGCTCGISRDVFMRVGAALNGRLGGACCCFACEGDPSSIALSMVAQLLESGDASLTTAVRCNHPDVVAAGQIPSEDGAVVADGLHLACARGSISMVDILLARYATSSNAWDHHPTLLRSAVQSGNLQVVKLLLECDPRGAFIRMDQLIDQLQRELTNGGDSTPRVDAVIGKHGYFAWDLRAFAASVHEDDSVLFDLLVNHIEWQQDDLLTVLAAAQASGNVHMAKTIDLLLQSIPDGSDASSLPSASAVFAPGDGIETGDRATFSLDVIQRNMEGIDTTLAATGAAVATTRMVATRVVSSILAAAATSSLVNDRIVTNGGNNEEEEDKVIRADAAIIREREEASHAFSAAAAISDPRPLVDSEDECEEFALELHHRSQSSTPVAATPAVDRIDDALDTELTHVSSSSDLARAAEEATEVEGVSFTEGDPIEAKYRGSKKFYPGKITFCHTHDLYDVEFDDGDQDTLVPRTSIRVPKAMIAAVAAGEATRFQEQSSAQRDQQPAKEASDTGDLIETRQHETLESPTRILSVEGAVTADAAAVADGDDGDDGDDTHHTGVAPSPVSYILDQDVVANFLGRGKFHPGKIVYVYTDDNTYDVQYSSFEETERRVPTDRIRARTIARSSSKESHVGEKHERRHHEESKTRTSTSSTSRRSAPRLRLIPGEIRNSNVEDRGRHVPSSFDSNVAESAAIASCRIPNASKGPASLASARQRSGSSCGARGKRTASTVVSWQELEEWRNVDLILNRKRRFVNPQSGGIESARVPWGEDFAAIQSLKRFAAQHPDVLRDHIATQLEQVVGVAAAAGDSSGRPSGSQSARTPSASSSSSSTAAAAGNAREALLLVKDLAFLLKQRLAPFLDAILPTVLPAVFHAEKRFLCAIAYEVLEALVAHCSGRKLVLLLLQHGADASAKRDDMRLFNLTSVYVEKCFMTMNAAEIQHLMARSCAATMLHSLARLLVCKSSPTKIAAQKTLTVIQGALGDAAFERMVRVTLPEDLGTTVLRVATTTTENGGGGGARSPTSRSPSTRQQQQRSATSPIVVHQTVSILQRMVTQRQNRVVPCPPQSQA